MTVDFKLRDFCYPVSLLRLRAFFERSQWFAREELIGYQEQRLREVVAHAYGNVPYYRDLFRGLGLTPADVRTVADLPKLPRLSKATLRSEFARLQAVNKNRLHPREVRTSGTSGQPCRLLMDKPANVLEFVYYWRHWSWAGYRLGHRFAELTSHFFLKEASRTGQLVHVQRLTGRLLLNSLALSPDVVTAFAQALRAYRPRFLKGIASALFYLALFFREGGIEDITFQGVFSTGEVLTPHYRRTIEEVFRCKVYDSYGHMERTVAVSECPQGGLHINPEYGVFELVDGVPLVPGRRGGPFRARVVGTALHNFAMPLLRYELGDLVEAEEPDPICPCGRAMPRIRRILGRHEDVVVGPDGRVVTTLFILFDQVPEVAGGQIIQEARDRLRVRVVRGAGYSARSEADLLGYLRRFVGPGMAVELEYLSHEALRRESGPGKLRTVISRVHAERADAPAVCVRQRAGG